jgi:hypothetical protein
MKMKNCIKSIIMVLIVMMCGLYIQPDDKELFMGTDVDPTAVRPNMVILIDTSTSMNDVIYFPKKGFDGILGTDDDGYDPAARYTGKFDSGIDSYFDVGEFVNDYTRVDENGNEFKHFTLNETIWVARWIITGADGVKEARKFTINDSELGNNWTGCYSDNGSGYKFEVGPYGITNFNIGDLVMYQNRGEPYSAALAKIVDIEKIDENTGWFTLAYDPDAPADNLDPSISIVGGPILPNSIRSDNNQKWIMGHFQRVPDNANWQPMIMKLYGVREVWGSAAQCQYNDAGYSENYLKWMFLHASDEQRKAVNHFTDYATFDTTTNIPDGYDGDWNGDGIPDADYVINKDPSYCDTGNLKDMTHLWTRIQVTREVLCWLARTHSKRIMLGLMKFEDPPNKDFCGNFDAIPGNEVSFDPSGTGGTELDGLGDMSETVSLTDYLNKTYGIRANSATPLAEALADVWYYYKPGPASKTYWPVSYELDNGISSTSNAVSPIKLWCQNNYVVVMTAGQSSKDDFSGDTNLFANKGGIFTTTSFTNPDGTTGDVKVQHDEDTWMHINPNGYERWRFGWGDTDSNDYWNGIPQDYDATTANYCPNYTCWDRMDDLEAGTDYLDDVAYFLRHQDMFPDDDNNSKYFRTSRIDPTDANEEIWPEDQGIFTYVIGFNADNDMLRETAQNGDGGYFTADTFQELKEAFANVIVSINLRNFAFSSITAPKKTSTASDEDKTVSYVGYFLPSRDSLWEGHLLSFALEDKWGWDNNGVWEYKKTELECLTASGGIPCTRSVTLSTDQSWDAALRMPDIRTLYTHDGSTLVDFSLSQSGKIRSLINDDPNVNVTPHETNQIITDIINNRLGDIFHSDVGFVGPPPFGKQFLSQINPRGPDDEIYSDFYSNNECRDRVLYVGTNDGVMHMFYADAPPPIDRNNDGVNDCPNYNREENTAGQEVWGFIPDEVLPSLKSIVLDVQHNYTVDGRITANDIYYKQGGNDYFSWATILVFGLRRGGRAFYALDITEVGTQPKLLWKFKDTDHSGQSWGKPTVGRIQYLDSVEGVIDKWVAILPGGFEFNTENPNDTRGKSVFVLDAATGQLLWKIAYITPAGEPPQLPDDGVLIDEDNSDASLFATSVPEFNYPIPSSLLVVDKDSDGYLDTIYFGNLGGHLFKADISNSDPASWTAQVIFKDFSIPETTPVIIESITEVVSDKRFDITVNTNQPPLYKGDTVIGKKSLARGHITSIDRSLLNVTLHAGTFEEGEELVSRKYDPIYMAPAVAFDTCYQLWVAFGTGDRDRPRTNFDSEAANNNRDVYGGRLIVFRDVNKMNSITEEVVGTPNTLIEFEFKTNQDLTPVNTLPDTIPADINGFYFDFPDNGERLFEPDPIVIPDESVIPHIYFNTYQPPPSVASNKEDPCDLPAEGVMKIYDIALKNCGALDTIEGQRETGRIAGGGIYAGKEYVMYKSESGDVADVPGGEGGQFIADTKRLPYPGGLVFWKEKKR